MSLRATDLSSALWLSLRFSDDQAFGFQSVDICFKLNQKTTISKEKLFSDVEYPEVTANIVGSSSTPSKSKGKQPVVSSEESDVDQSPYLKDILIEPEGIYWHTQTRTGAIAPVDYSLLARGIEVNDEHSAIIES